MGDFYITLPSNASASLFPGNKISNFTTKLPRPIDLDERKWEVALVSISFPHSWYTFDVDQYFRVEYFEKVNNVFVNKQLSSFVPAGNYSNPQDICDIMNNLLSVINIKRKPTLSFNKFSGYVTIKCGKDAKDQNISPIMWPELSNALGIRSTILLGKTNDIKIIEEKIVPSIAPLPTRKRRDIPDDDANNNNNNNEDGLGTAVASEQTTKSRRVMTAEEKQKLKDDLLDRMRQGLDNLEEDELTMQSSNPPTPTLTDEEYRYKMWLLKQTCLKEGITEYAKILTIIYRSVVNYVEERYDNIQKELIDLKVEIETKYKPTWEEVGELKQELKDKLIDVMNKKEEIINLKIDLESCNDSVADLNKQIIKIKDDSEKEIFILNNEQYILVKEKEKLQSELSAFRDEISILSERKTELLNEIEDKQIEMVYEMNSYFDCENQLKSNQERVATLTRLSGDAFVTITNLSDDVARKSEEIQKAEKKIKSLELSLTAEIGANIRKSGELEFEKDKYEKLLLDVEQTNVQLQISRNDYKTLENESKEIQDKFLRLNITKINELKESLRLKETNLQLIKGELEKMKNDYAIKIEEINKLKERLDFNESEYKQKTDIIAENLKSCSTTVNSIQLTIDEKQNTIQATKLELFEKNEKLIELREKIENIEHENKQYKETKLEMAEEIKSIKYRIGEKTKLYLDEVAKNQELEQKIKILEFEVLGFSNFNFKDIVQSKDEEKEEPILENVDTAE